MKTAYLLVASLFTASLTLGGCGVDRAAPVEEDAAQGYYFSGYVYDGVSAETLTDYTLSLTFDVAIDEFNGGDGGSGEATRTLTASVDSNGRYRVGPLKTQSDFTVEIAADGYRAFTSHNPMRTFLPGTEDQQRSELFEAYLFPSDIESPAITLELFAETDGADRPSGSIRLIPSNGNASSALSLAGTLGASINNQLWFNDNDARNATVVKTFRDGELTLAAGELVYGVTYTGTFFDVAGHQYQDITFTAGLTGSQSVILTKWSDSPLSLVSSSLDGGVPNAEGTIVFTFNRPIAFSPALSPGYIAELIDDNFSIDSPDADGDLDVNVLVFSTDEPEDQERGTSIVIEGNRLTLTWANESDNFETEDADDPILSATYAGLNLVELQAVGETTTVALSTLVGNNQVTVQLAPTAP